MSHCIRLPSFPQTWHSYKERCLGGQSPPKGVGWVLLWGVGDEVLRESHFSPCQDLFRHWGPGWEFQAFLPSFSPPPPAQSCLLPALEEKALLSPWAHWH